jgi:hypothetical protein
LDVLDVRNPCRPVWVGGYFTGGRVTGLQVIEPHAFVSDMDYGLMILDVSNPAQPRRVGLCSGAAGGFQVVGSYAYVASGGLKIVDVSNRTSPVVVGNCATPRGGSVVCVSGNYAYVSIDMEMYTDLGIIDVSDPVHPVFVKSVWVFLTTGEGSWITDLKAVGHHLFICDSTPHLKVFDISNPTNPTLATLFPTPAWPNTVMVEGNYAYVAEGGAGVEVLDVSNPANLVALGRFDSGGPASRVSVAGNRVYVAEGSQGMAILLAAPKVQFTLQVNGTPGVPFTIEATTNLTGQGGWAPVLTTNSATMPYFFTDPNVNNAGKFYRVQQP